MNASPPILKLERIHKYFSAYAGAPPVPILREVTLEIFSGQSLAIIGPSGSGKSTLLNLAGTLDRPDAGRVWLEGQDLSSLDEIHMAQVRNQKIGFIFQSHHLLPHCTALENVLVPSLAGPSGRSSPEVAQRAERLLKRVGLGDRMHHRPGQMSGGERQRVAVVRALINRPCLLLADEPTGALDRASAAELGRLLTEINREEKTTLVVVTHALDLARLADEVYELKEGGLHKLARENLD